MLARARSILGTILMIASAGLFAYQVSAAGSDPANTQRLAAQIPTLGSTASPVQDLGQKIGRLEIPRIGASHPIIEGVGQSQLARGIGHYPATARGGRGVSAFAGHRTGFGDPFIDLDKLEPGDTIIATIRGTDVRYRVTRSLVVDPDDDWVLQGDPRSPAGSQIVLTTCTPKGTSLRRLIVFGERA
jgi:sortase A